MYNTLRGLVAVICLSGVITAYDVNRLWFDDEEDYRRYFNRRGNIVDSEWVRPSNPFLIPNDTYLPPRDYSYTARGGAKNWPATFAACGGENQSPVDINTNEAPVKQLSPLIFRDYWANGNTALLNNTGKSVSVKLQGGGTLPTTSGGPLSGEYTFNQLHFHWGVDASEGSEHTVDLERFSMEAHLVHYKSSYGNMEEALKHKDGLLVVAFFLQASNNKLNAAFDELVSHLPKVRKAYSTVALQSPSTAFQWLKDSTSGEYVTYPGSLTTPPCREVVTWVVNTTPISVAKSQVNEFRALRGADGDKIKLNYRPVQRYAVRDLYRGA